MVKNNRIPRNVEAIIVKLNQHLISGYKGDYLLVTKEPFGYVAYSFASKNDCLIEPSVLRSQEACTFECVLCESDTEEARRRFGKDCETMYSVYEFNI